MNVFSAFIFIFSILGCVLGAGFVSGAEIQKFFVKFGGFGLIGIILSNIVFCLCIWIIYKEHSREYLHKRVDILPYCQLFISATMVAGIGDIFGNKIFINFAILIVLSLVLFFGVKTANVINVFVSLSLIILLPFVLKINKVDVNFKIETSIIAWLHAILYALMNISTGRAIIKNVTKGISKKIFFISNILLFIILTILQIIFYFNIYGIAGDMPMLIVASGNLLIVYKILFVVAMLSTLVSSSFGAKEIFKHGGSRFSNFIVCVCTSTIIVLISFVGFSKIIEYIYPIIGAVLLMQYILNKNLNKKQTKLQLKFDKNAQI